MRDRFVPGARPLRRSVLAVLVVSAALAGAAPARGQAAGGARDAGRAPDGLLERSDLQTIVEQGIARDGAALAARLADSDPVVRARAAFTLASVQDTAAVPALVAALGDSDARVRADAAFAIGQSPVDSVSAGRVADALLEALAREADPAARARLYEALGKTGEAASLARLAAQGPPAGEEAAFALGVARYGLRGVFDPAAVTRLVPLLAHDDPAVREAAAYPLGRWRESAPWAEAAGAAARAALDDAYVYQAAERGTAAPAGAAPEIHLVAAVGKLGDPEDSVRLVHWLEDAVDWRVRVSAARALAPRAADEAVGRALIAALGDPSIHVAVSAAAALADADSLSERVLHDLAVVSTTRRAEWRISGESLPALARGGIDAFVILWIMWLDASDQGNAPARAKALRALGQGSAPPGFRVLEDLATWEDPRVAAAALAGLAERWRRGAVDETATVERYRAAFAGAIERGDVATVSETAPVLADTAFVKLGSIEVLARGLRAMELPRDREAMMAIRDALAEVEDPAAAAVVEEARARLEGDLGAGDRAARVVNWPALAALGPEPRLVLVTSRGRIVVALDVEQAPLTVQTIVGLAQAGEYDGVPFHRVVPNFVIQGGDVARGDGYGGPGFEIVSEFTRIPYDRGVIGMASAGKDTEGSQFFLTHSIQPHLDGRYTSFGRIVEGIDVLDAVLESDLVVSARVE